MPDNQPLSLFAEEPDTPPEETAPQEDPGAAPTQSEPADQGDKGGASPADDEAALLALAEEENAKGTTQDEGPPPDEGPKALEITPEMEIVLDGQKITGEELKRGWLRQEDYTRKTQMVAEVKKNLETAIEEFEKLRAAYVNAAQAWDKELQALYGMQDEDVDWDKLAEEDPGEYTRLRHAVEQRKARIEQNRAKLQQDIKKYQEEQTQARQKQLQEYVDQQRQTLLKMLPEWSDKSVAQKEATALSEFLLKLPTPFTEDEVNSILDARIVYLAHQAKKWADLQQKLQERKKAGAPVRPPIPKTTTGVRGAGQSSAQEEERFIDGTPWLSFPSMTGRK